MGDFKWKHFRGEIILGCVRWYCKYGISYRDLEEMMLERGVTVDHSTLYRWVQEYAPEIERRLRWYWKPVMGDSWRVDETYAKVKGKWVYLYRAIDKRGRTIDFYLSSTRNTEAAKRFLGKALKSIKSWAHPQTLNTDKAPAYGAAIAQLKEEGKCRPDMVHRQVKYLNNRIESDHGKRIRDLKDQQLYRIEKTVTYGELDALLDKTVDLTLIEEQWDQMIRVIGSLKNKLTPAHEIIRRIGKGSPSDRLSKAFTQLGRLIKTEYILRYLTTPELRQKVQRQINKGEHRHALSRWIFFANQGKFQIGDYEEIMNKASCLSLVSNAVLYWNTVKMEKIIKALEENSEKIDEETLSHISLLSYKHVIPMGTYFVEPELERFTL